MSTDTYFDYHSPELFPLHEAMNGGRSTADPIDHWKVWYTKLKELEDKDGHDAHYCPERVAYVYNLLCDENYQAWRAFKRKWWGVLVNDINSITIANDWKELYDASQTAKFNDYKDDICSASEVKEMLLEHCGKYLTFRVD